MKKEVVIAVILGLALGLFITYGVYTARQSMVKPPAADLTDIPSASPAAATSTLILSSPADETVQMDKTITVAGTTTPKAFVVILVNGNETITTADDTGNFSVVVDLTLGGNTISVHSLDEDGKETVVQRTVVYTTPDFEGENASASAQPASPKPSSSPSPKATSKPTN